MSEISSFALYIAQDIMLSSPLTEGDLSRKVQNAFDIYTNHLKVSADDEIKDLQNHLMEALSLYNFSICAATREEQQNAAHDLAEMANRYLPAIIEWEKRKHAANH